MDSSLETYLHLKTKMRQAKDAVLREAGFSWSGYMKLEAEAIAEMLQSGSKELDAGQGFYAEIESKPVRAYKESDAKLVGHTHHISIHKRREQ